MLEDVKYFCVHHSAADRDSTPEEIDQLHRNKGWPSIGYHDMVLFDGTLILVGDLDTQRACVTAMNDLAHCIELNGLFIDGRRPTEAQVRTLAFRWRQLEGEEGYGHALDLVGHKDIAPASYPTGCPGDEWHLWKVEIEDAYRELSAVRIA